MAFVNLPPNLQDIFFGIYDRIAKLESGPNQPMVYAQSAQSTALAAYTLGVSAQADATAALADAAVAYTTAVNSLQPSAYAIQNPTTKQLSSIDATGLTIWSGGSATSGARVVLNSAGFAGYNSSGSPTFAITASTGAAVFSGSITGSAITGSTLNISGNCIIDASGLLTATGATITGTITSSNATITGGSLTVGSTFQVTTGGLLTASSANISGTITATAGNIGGFIVGSTYLSSGAGGTGFYINSSTGNASFATITATGNISGVNLTGSGTVTATTGLTLTTSTCAVSAGGNAFNNVGAYTGTTISTTGSITANGELYAAGHGTTTNAANGYVFVSGGRIARSTASSQRYKENIVDITTVPDLDPKKLLNLPVRAFSYKAEYLDSNDDRSTMLMPGFIAEEVDAVYPMGADYIDGPESWNDRILLPAMLSLIQDQDKRIKLLEAK